MRSTLKTAFAVLIAVLAISAIGASSALATPEWYAKKAGVYAKVTTPIKVSSIESFELIDTKVVVVGKVAVSCSVHSEGQVGAGGAGKLATSMEFAPGCTAGEHCEKIEKTPHAGGFPWGTELYTEGSAIRDKILSGTETPWVSFTCTVNGAPGWTTTCDVNTSTHMTNNSSGYVEAEFEANSNKTHCSIGGENAGELKGVIKIKPTEAEKTAGVEAIKVE